MRSAGVAELKANLSKYLEKVKAGQQVLITDRGLPVAKLAPLEAGQRSGSRRERLVKAGLIHPGKGKLPRFLLSPPKGAVAVGQGVLAALVAERGESR